MSNRKRPAIPSTGVIDRKKAKQDPPSEKSTEEIPQEPAVETSEAATPELEYIQVIITGPRRCGKSCLVLSYMGELFPASRQSFLPGQSEFLSRQYLHILPTNQPVMIWDLDARDEFIRYREKSYPEADIALLCFDVSKSMDLIKEEKQPGEENNDLEYLLRQWYTELEEHCPNTPIILVGLKRDLKLHPEGTFFSEEERNYLMEKYPKIKSYKEVSVFMNKNEVNELFTTAIDSVDKPIPKKMFANCGFEFRRHR